MGAKQLFTCDPIINYNTTYGTLFSILSDELWPWIFNNFIQIRFAFDWGSLVFDNQHLLLKNCPGIDYYNLSKDIIALKWPKVGDLIVDLIDNDYYVVMFLDWYYLSSAPSHYHEIHMPHEVFIYGYDKHSNKVYLSDNFSKGKFVRRTCSFEELELGYQLMGRGSIYWPQIKYLKRMEKVSCNFDMELVLNSINDYLCSKRSVFCVEDQVAYGLNALYVVLNKIKDSRDKLIDIDVRPLYLLYEHKLLMEKRFQYIGNQGLLSDAYSIKNRFTEIKNSFLVMRNLALKYNLNKDTDTADRVIELYESSVNKETALLNEISYNGKSVQQSISDSLRVRGVCETVSS